MRKNVLSLSPCRMIREAIWMIGLVVLGEVSFAGTTYYVSASGEDAATGLSEAEAFATLAKAIATANADPAAEAVVVLSDLAVPAPVEVTGGYRLRGYGASPDETKLAAGAQVAPLVTIWNREAIVENLTLSGAMGGDVNGGVLALHGATATNCIIRNGNVRKGNGGGIWSDGGRITHCVVEDNRIRFTGGEFFFGAGIYQTGADAVTEHSIIRNNRMDTYYSGGGGIQSIGGTIRYCIVTNNFTRNEVGHGGAGGGINGKGPVVVHHCLVARNRGGWSGGGIYIEGNGGVVSNCTIVCNTVREGQGGICVPGGTSKAEFSDLIIWGNSITFSRNPLDEEAVFPGATTRRNILAPRPIGKDPVSGDPAFIDPERGDFRLSAASVAIGAGTGGCDLGYLPFDESALSVGMATSGKKAFPPGPHRFTAQARGGTGAITYRWRLVDRNTCASGDWTGCQTIGEFEPDLAPGHYEVVVEARDESGATATFSRSFYVATKTVYLVSAGMEGNSPLPPYDTPGTAANDVLEAIRYCTDGSELIVSDGDYGVEREVHVPAKVTIRSLNGPEKTSLYRIGPYGKGTSSRVVHLHGQGAVLSGFTVSNGYFKSVEDTGYGCNVLLYGGDIVTNCIITKGNYPMHQFSSAAIAAMNGKIYDTIVRDNRGGGGFGGAVSLKGPDAHMADCVITNHVNVNNYYTSGLGVYAEDSLIERCVICDNINKGNPRGGGRRGCQACPGRNQGFGHLRQRGGPGRRWRHPCDRSVADHQLHDRQQQGEPGRRVAGRLGGQAEQGGSGRRQLDFPWQFLERLGRFAGGAFLEQPRRCVLFGIPYRGAYARSRDWRRQLRHPPRGLFRRRGEPGLRHRGQFPVS